jgi:hypothetical protein
MVCFDRLNLTTITFVVAIDVTRSKLEENMFSVGVLIKESS